MNLKLSKWEVKTLLFALYLAEEWEVVSIDSYNHMASNPEVKRSRKNIDKFRALRKKIQTLRKKIS